MFKVLHSSAGAGKTHALVKHYLRHCLGTSDHGAYRHVLALTFTNKAAAEMKERVMRYLEGLAEGGPFHGPLADVAEELQRESGIDGAELAHRAAVVQKHMLHHWSDVAISTIDAFTRRIVKPFARDLRLDQDLRMTTEQEHYRNEAVGRLIDRAGSDERTTELLTRTCMQLVHEERPWEPTKPLLDLSRELLNERAIGPLLRSRERSVDELYALMERLNVETARFREQVRSLGRKAVALFEEHGIERADIAYNGVLLGYFKKMVEFTDTWDEPGVQTLKPLETGKLPSGKAGPEAIAALRSITDAVKTLFNEAERLRSEGHPRYTMQRAVSRELLPAFALHELDATLEELKREDAVTFFSDLTRRVAEVVKDEPVPFIYERLGERYKHFLIDEFQDTSLLQWNALLPLLDHALSTGGSVLLVGDAKQAIYRWRNGEVRLFVDLPRLFGKDPDDEVQLQREDTLRRTFVKGEPLAHNRRSAQRIIEFNNALFGVLAESLSADLRPVYNEHAQQRSRPGSGTVQIGLGEMGMRGNALQEVINQHALNCVTNALANGFAPGDVAILVRSKRTGRAVAEHLLAHGHAVVSPDGLQLSADPAVQLLVDLLRYTVQANEQTAAHILQRRAMLESGRLDQALPIRWSVPAGTNGKHNTAAAVDAWLAAQRKPELTTTIGALVEGFANKLGLRVAEDAAVLTFLDEVHAWTTDHAQDILGFLEHWDRSGAERSNSAAEAAEAVQVMTVHKSKGLQFPVVIVPDARMVSGGQRGELFWVDPGMAVPEMDLALVRESKALRDLGTRELLDEDGLRDLDALNLLYVAFTRAEQELHAFVPHASDAITKGLHHFVNSHPHLAATMPGEVSAASPDKASAILALRDVSTPGAASAWNTRPASNSNRETNERMERAYGIAVHAMLATARTIDDLPNALSIAVQRGELTSLEAAELSDRLRGLLANDPLAKWFTPGAEIRSEAVIITAEGRSLRPDRVLLHPDGTDVLEIKTGKPDPAHIDQLLEYIGILRDMGHANVRGLLWYVGTDELHPVT